ncbi:MAG: polyisoprenoid-binding protein [Methylococcus sp.]|nr:MAG: polyisoprenoid-binding protein [Methylococcus sp.]
MRNWIVTGLLATLIAGPVLAGERFTIDPNHTLPMFEVSHLGFSTQIGRFDRTSGTIELDREKKTGTVRFSIAADSINMGQAKWDDHMKSADFFNAAKFPTITFNSDAIRYEGDKPVAAEGQLTLLGVTRPVSLKIERFTCGVNPIVKKDLCAADIVTTLKRSEFGMTKYVPGISDEVRVRVPVEAYKD